MFFHKTTMSMSMSSSPSPSLGISRSNSPSSSWTFRTSYASFPRRSSAIRACDHLFEEDDPEASLQVLLPQIKALLVEEKRSFKKERIGLKRDDGFLTCYPKPFFSDECNKAFNELASLEYSISRVYLLLGYFFKRWIDGEKLMGFFKFFRESERRQLEDVEKLFNYQHKRSGKPKYRPVQVPLTELDQPDRGVPLKALELTQSLERLAHEKLLELLSVAKRSDDPHIKYFIESEFLTKQAEVLKKICDYVDQVRIYGENGLRGLDSTFIREYEAPYFVHEIYFKKY